MIPSYIYVINVKQCKNVLNVKKEKRKEKKKTIAARCVNRDWLVLPSEEFGTETGVPF